MSRNRETKEQHESRRDVGEVQRRTESGPDAAATRDGRLTIDRFSVADIAPAVQLKAFDDAVTRVHQTVARSGQTLEGASHRFNVQMHSANADSPDASGIHAAAERGTRGGGSKLPFYDRIQASFGGHDISSIRAHTAAEAREANTSMGSIAYASGHNVAFKGSPDLFTAAHEAAHVIQQRGGVSLRDGVGQAGDVYEQHADAVAARVVQGQSAEGILGRFAGGGAHSSVQARGDGHIGGAAAKPIAGRFVQMEGDTAKEPAKLAADTSELTVEQVVALSHADLLTYCQTRPAAHLTSLRHNDKFLQHFDSVTVDQMAEVVVTLILRTPDQVVDRAGARAEAMRILQSQLRDKEIMKNLLRNDVTVVIVPQNMLMTDLPEFAAQRNTFTFDGRPWDTTRGLGGHTTAIAEENLMGTDVDASNSRLGWDSQASMNAARAKDPNAMPVAGEAGVTTFTPGVYCSGYSTTNHEFFHTIHMYGLAAADVALIQREYDAKKVRVPAAPAATTATATSAAAGASGAPAAATPALTANDEPWADGIRRGLDGSASENYCSSTVYEYFAQTGCAFQGTNVGTDPYTGRPRNNGRAWVSANEQGLSPLLSRVCSSTELQGVNPRDERARQAAAAATASGKSALRAVVAVAAGKVPEPAAASKTEAPAKDASTTSPSTQVPAKSPTAGEAAPQSAKVAGAVAVLQKRS